MLVYVIGFASQLFFSARVLVQWIMSEKAKRVLSPSLFWIFSLAGSYLMCIYGWMRHDFAIILGQVISYYVYLWNLYLKGVWRVLPAAVRWALFLTPVVAAGFVLSDAEAVMSRLFETDGLPVWMVVYGSLGQIIFTFRFIYQGIYSLRKKESVLPTGFWVISLVGSLTIVSYAVMRLDPVLILGQSFGMISYIRNLFIGRKKGG